MLDADQHKGRTEAGCAHTRVCVRGVRGVSVWGV